MRNEYALGAIGALTMALTAVADVQTIDVGTVMNVAPAGAYQYTGSFGGFLSAQTQFFGYTHTVIAVDLNGILQSVGANALLSVSIKDTGNNTYAALSPGADIDLFAFEGISGDAQPAFSYTGPNQVHAGESSEALHTRAFAVDSFSGAQDAWNMTHVSLGYKGALKATFGTAGGGTPGDPNGPIFIEAPGTGSLGATKLLISEAGFSESFQILLEVTTVPVPAPCAGLALLGLFIPGRRRRHGS